ncbi:MAG: prephenate dehydrogenase/arogenate dehydrogenase family protein [Actinomycetota bacterium]|nr:prephenate dehydrogenase/arogenate dehydrogenase family protein [Actinomycetota bacterium]
MPRVGVIGTGLVGGSIAAGLTEAGWEVVGYDADPESSAIARERGLIGSIADSIGSLVSAQPEIIVVAAPPKATVEIVSGLVTDAIVMDVTGVKTPVVRAGEHLVNFVGTHPMAGREASGPRTASSALFKGASWVVIKGSHTSATDKVVELIQTLGANPVLMSAEAHDDAVAAVSHLPHLLAASLLGSTARIPEALDLAAGSFRDLTRVASSQPLPWVEILKSNRNAVLGAIEALREQLDTVEAAIESDDDALLTYLSESREVRRSLGAPVAAVRVALADEPGEIAKVGHALEASHVDVRDIQMRHAPHGGGGVLTLSVRPGEEEALRHALADVGLVTVP